jgi:hypothetical protein
MEIIGIVTTVLVTIAALLQGADAGLNLWNRWKKSRQGKAAKAGRRGSERSPISIRLTKRTVEALMFAIPWYGLVIIQAVPAYDYLSVLPLYETISVMVAYFVFFAMYPLWIRKAKKRWPLLLAMLFPLLDFTLANYIAIVPDFAQTESYPSVFAIVHSTSLTGFKFFFMFHFVQKVLNPWVDSLPER